jgi:hypothetical protein
MVNASFITADIARSTELFTSAEMEQLSLEIQTILQNEECIFTFNRFDSFQVLHRSPQNSLLLSLKIRMVVKKFSSRRPDVRICMGLGFADPAIVDFTFLKDPLFVLTGREFNRMEAEKDWYRIVLTDRSKDVFQPGLAAIALFLDHLVRGLTFKQSLILHDLLNSHSQKEIAEFHGKSLPTINKQVKAMNWESFREVDKLFREIIKNLPDHAV